MSKVRLFIDNFLVYGVGGIIGKAIPLVMVPIVTRIMPSTDYFGISDLSNTIVQFGCAIAVMGMYDAMYRMFFDKDDVVHQKVVCSTALVFTFFTSAIIFVFMLLFRETIAQYFFCDKQYAYVVYLSAMATLVGATNQIVSAPTRMQNKKKVYVVVNTMGPFLSYSIAIPLLLAGYYVIALPLAAVIAGISVEFLFWIINREWFTPRLFDKNVLKQLLIIAIPLLPNFLIYWVFNSCDKVMITNILGIGAAGIYSVGAKLGYASQLIYVAFAGGWQYFAFSTMRERNQVESNSKIYEYLGIISFVVIFFVCAFCFELVQVLFKAEYIEGYIVVPYLFLAPLLQMLFQVACNQFLVIKKTWPNIFILFLGVVCNVLLNILLIPLLGIEGASIATVSGYLISNIVCMLVLMKMELMRISYKFIISSIVAVLYVIVWRLFFSTEMLFGVMFALFATVILLRMYKQEMIGLLVSVRKHS